MIRKFATGLCLLAMIGLPGCSDNAVSVAVPNNSEQAAEQFAAVIAPALDVMNRFDLDDVLAGTQAATLGGIVEECTDYSEVCSSGALDLCFNESGETYDFASCVASSSGKMFNGTINDLQSTVNYDVDVDDAYYDGSIGLTQSESCMTESLSGFAVTAGSTTTTVSGTLTYCEGQSRPSGTSTFAFGGSTGSWNFDLTFNGTDTASAVVTNVSTQVVDTCSIDLNSGQATCGEF